MNKRNIWWETHRPEAIWDFVGNEAIKEEINAILYDGAPMQHFIFNSYGAGTGKTTMAFIISQTLGWQLHKFNASSKKLRGIEFIEEYIIPLSRSGLNEVIIFLDEADRLTPQAQDALKGVIEESSCYFILTCNDLTKVSPWLQSRCQVRTFEPIDEESMAKRLGIIASFESLEIADVDIRAICKGHSGDLRNAIGALQTYSSKPNATSKQQFIQSLLSPDVNYSLILRLCFRSRDIQGAYKELVSSHAAKRKVVRGLFDYALENPASDEAMRRVILASVQAERDLLNGVDETIAVHEFVRILCGEGQ